MAVGLINCTVKEMEGSGWLPFAIMPEILRARFSRIDVIMAA